MRSRGGANVLARSTCTLAGNTIEEVAVISHKTNVPKGAGALCFREIGFGGSPARWIRAIHEITNEFMPHVSGDIKNPALSSF
jgi:hypothetical protein